MEILVKKPVKMATGKTSPFNCNYSRKSNPEWKYMEAALAASMQEDDFRALIQSFYRKLEENLVITDEGIKVIGRSDPNSYSLVNAFWKYILTGNSGQPSFDKPAPKFPKSRTRKWSELFISTIHENFSGSVATLASEKVVKKIGAFMALFMVL